ncbi:hypothetical protein SLEP1_g23764 [Rubroshorea leprosula]|uniref:Uncharacterized protein n=1 Tax=Rubroshorea leprosula TaxID=152421 RepID=A0AAV5JGG1_9ROSI|nr:hypothetical protein SLEP1_g23764 [Rubroshorea leprosula]
MDLTSMIDELRVLCFFGSIRCGMRDLVERQNMQINPSTPLSVANQPLNSVHAQTNPPTRLWWQISPYVKLDIIEPLSFNVSLISPCSAFDQDCFIGEQTRENQANPSQKIEEIQGHKHQEKIKESKYQGRNHSSQQR